ncbi:hypothetical protein SASPL_142015 [Salvia splendens]|uniref:DCD domain-containing protein n=2 Tax=Salvia splendens TaxID=180675 RepID=A0A8X8Z938_SALSN|nr:uncharacterized protein LOC121772677 isoform X1 [Salvia splendens]KAG6395882.1 hypothetical protein SASPL_142015 [Salvia splendens]
MLISTTIANPLAGGKMDYHEHDNVVASGNIPEFGAIFFSNIEIKKECLQRNIFALPSSHTEFVTHVKEGMVLFLFETRKRELFGVYQASSDGAVDINPHAFSYSGQHFPAQVRFRQIWHCDPISENEFKDAIIENYFSARKFNIGLSKDQVRSLLYLFSSRKIKSKMPAEPRSEAIVEVSAKESRLLGDDRHERYMAPLEYDNHVSSLTRGKEDEFWIDNMANAEGNIYPFTRDDFLAKRRRIGKEGRFTTNDIAGNALYCHGYQSAFRTGSPKDSLDEVRTSANAGRFLSVQMGNEDQVNKMQTRAQYPENSIEPLDVRAHGDYTYLQRSTLRDDYNIHSGHQQAFASDNYESSMAQSKHLSDDNRFLLDDCVIRDCVINVDKSVAINDHHLNLCRQEREMVNDREWLNERKLENRYHLDCLGSTISAIDPPASHLYKIRKTDATGRFQIDGNEPRFGTCSAEGFSSKTVLHPRHCGYRIIEGRKYPIVEGRSTENMVDKVSPTVATNAGYVADEDIQILDSARYRKSDRVDYRDPSQTHTDPVMSMKYPLFSQSEQNLSSFPDKFPEEQFSQFTVSHGFHLLPSIYEDATITRTVPYSPDHPNLSHGCSSSKEANQNSTSMHMNHLRDSSLENLYPLSRNRLQQYPSESKNFGRSQDATREYRNNGFEMSTSCLRSSLLRESSNSFLNPDFSTDMDLNTSAPVNYRGSLSSKLSPHCTDPENFEGQRGLLACYPKSRDHDFAFDGYLPEASENWRKHGIGMSAGKYSNCSESQDLGTDICLREKNLAIYGNQHFRFSRNMDPRELHKSSGANSTLNRRSVFSRLSSKPSRFSEERNDIDLNHQDCYIDATADELMEMLKQDDNLSPRKLRKSGVVGQPKESAVHEKETQRHLETEHCSMEKKRLNSATQATADSMDEIPKETRTLNFKRRSERKKLVGISSGSASHSSPTDAREVVKNSTNSTSRRKKLVRPAFSKTDTASNAATCGNETSQPHAPILEKDDKQSSETATNVLESEIPRDSTHVLAPHTCQVMDCNKEPPYSEEQKDAFAPVLPTPSVEHVKDDILVGCSKVPWETSLQMIQISVEGGLAKDTDGTSITSLDLPEPSFQGVGLGSVCKNNEEVPRETSQQMISDIQTSVEGGLAKDNDGTTITSLDLPEPSFEGVELGSSGCKNNREKHLKTMKIILTPKKDVKAASSQ